MALSLGAGLDVRRLQRQIVAVVTDVYQQFFVLFGAGTFDVIDTANLPDVAVSWKAVDREINRLERTLSDFPKQFQKGRVPGPGLSGITRRLG